MPIAAIAFLLGGVCGLRSMMGPAAVCWAAARGRLGLAATPLSFVGGRPALLLCSLLAAGELVADKLPSVPPRTSAVGLLVRAFTGALCAAALALAGQRPVVVPALLGICGAIVAAFAGVRYRGWAASRLGALPSALAEDAVAVAAAILLLHLF